MRCNSKANWRTILRGCLYGGFLQFQEGAIGKNKSSVESQGTSVELQEALIQYTGEPADLHRPAGSLDQGTVCL